MNGTGHAFFYSTRYSAAQRMPLRYAMEPAGNSINLKTFALRSFEFLDQFKAGS